MRAIRRILVAVKDPTSRSLPAVIKAAQLAKAFGAQLELFHSLSSPMYVDAYAFNGDGMSRIESDTRTRTLAQLERIAARIQAQKIRVCASVHWDYPVYEAIVRRARQIGADLIVAERHGGLHIAPGLLQLTDWELLRLSPVPVLLVKNGRPYRRPVVLAAIDPGHRHAKPANLDTKILDVSSAFGSALHGSVHAVHAYIPVSALPYTTIPSAEVDKLEVQAAIDAQRRLDQALAKTRMPKANRHLVAREPVFGIDQVARDTHSAIVVMGAISRSGLKRFLIGNTAESLLDYLTCDALVLKPSQFVTKVQTKQRGVRYAVSPALQGMY
jgi:universal stress protein E